MTDQSSNAPLLYKPEMHWIGIALAIVPFLVVAIVISLGPPYPFLWLLFVPCFPALGSALITFFSTRIELHPKHLTYASGVFRRLTFDLPITRVESVVMDQSLLGRYLGYGQVTVIAIGSTPVTTPCIKQPAKFLEAMQSAMAQRVE